MDFSGKSGKAAGNNVAQLRRDWFNGWRKHDDGPRLTERSLRMWAKTDNSVKYNEIQDEYLGEYIRQEIEPTHHHIALLMKKKYGANLGSNALEDLLKKAAGKSAISNED
jgi:hypothetical protein